MAARAFAQLRVWVGTLPPMLRAVHVLLGVTGDLHETAVAEHDALAPLHQQHAHGQVVEDVAQVALAFAQLLLHAAAPRDVLDHADVVDRRLARLPDGRNREIDPDLVAPLAQQALFHVKGGDVASRQALELRLVGGIVIGMAQALHVALQQLLGAVADDVAVALVHAQDLARIHARERHAHRRLVEHRAKTLLALLQGFVGGLRLAQCQGTLTHQQAGQHGQQQRQRHARAAHPPRQLALHVREHGARGHEGQAPAPVVHLQHAQLTRRRSVGPDAKLAQQCRRGRSAIGHAAHVFKPQRHTVEKTFRREGIEHGADPHGHSNRADEARARPLGKDGLAQDETLALLLLLQQLERCRHDGLARGTRCQHGRQVGWLRADVQPPDALVTLPGPEVFDDVVVGPVRELAQDLLLGALTGAPLGAQALRERRQPLRGHPAGEVEIADLGIALAYRTLGRDTLEIAVAQVRIDQKQVAHAGNDLGVGDDALLDSVGRRAHLFSEAHVGNGLARAALLLDQRIGQRQAHQRHRHAWYPGSK